MESKYGSLNARNILIRHKLAEKKRFDSADYFTSHAPAAAASVEARPASLVSSPVPQVSHVHPLSPGHLGAAFFKDGLDAHSSPSSKMKNTDTCTTVPIAQLLMRRKLNGKERFDSADYSMQLSADAAKEAVVRKRQACGALKQPIAGVVSGMDTTTSSAPGKLVVSATTPTLTRQDSYGKMAARGILLRKQMAERKRFDSADYFSGKKNDHL